ncbi:MAG: exodeoxyribonuclease VII small subunit [Desulfuromonadales bacterium]|nr:exodeoxyribonuclease VII small subunit [Desulfuromonadales bacterium]
MEKETFEAALKALEGAVQSLERGELSLEKALSCFEDGVRSAGLCRQFLQEVETRLELLLKDSEGNLRVEPHKEE